MNKEELRHLSSDCEYFLNGNGRGEINLHNFVENLRTTYIEPKEKRIEELEETINKLREQLSLRYNLEDKITELKLKLEALEGQTPWKDIKDKSEIIGKLTKATEIIKLLLHALKNEGSDYTFALENTHPVLAEAEQFLKGDGCPDCFCKDCTKEDCGIKKLGLVEVEK